MEVRVGVRGSVIVDDNIHSLDIDAAAKNISGHKDTFFKSFERGIPADTKWNCQLDNPKIECEPNEPFLLGKTRMDADTWKVTSNEKLVQFDRACDGFHENDDLFNEFE